ncbi:MAG: hypothetical protein HY804_05405 [Nitrospinae bacterium]|nr:hypothetical protein [Nitrospinota bacterium]
MRLSRAHKVAPSIAEQAIFIPKPHKRVEFKLDTGPAPALGSGKPDAEPIPLPGQGASGGEKTASGDVSGQNIAAGEFGANGLTARFNKAAYAGKPGGYVKMEINATPEKQHEVIATQEEGRQVNHREIHFTQQYDTYGRPRIGFSREPYDFAATKYVSITSQLQFRVNMSKTHEQYDEYNLSGKQAEKMASGEMQALNQEELETTPQEQIMGAAQAAEEVEKPDFFGAKKASGEVPVFGKTSDSTKVSGKIFLGPQDGPKPDEKVSAKESFNNQKIDTSGGGHGAKAFAETGDASQEAASQAVDVMI